MSKHHGPEMLDQVDPRVRRLLIRCRGMAMRGEPKQSDMMLREEIGRRVGLDDDQDVVALAMVRAELFYLNGCVEKAIEQFETHISPRIDRLDSTTRFAVEQNLIDLKMERGGPTASSALSDFYHLYDRRMTVAKEWSDYSNSATAWDAVEEENHPEALAALWRDVVKSYREGGWDIHRAAMLRLGREWLRIGEPSDAAYCALLARDDKLARKVADDLLGRMDRALIDQVVARILAVANLQRHFCVACEFLNQVGDAIADGQITAVAEWLLVRCSLSQDGDGTSGSLRESWAALQAIAQRIPEVLARRAVNKAVSHPAWVSEGTYTDSWLVRQQMVKTVNHLVSSIPIADLGSLAHHTLPLFKDRKSNTDLGDVVNLLCHIARRDGAAVRDFIGDCLFDPTQPRYHILGQVAHIFQREFLPADRLVYLTTQITRNLRLQVQRGPEGHTFEKLPSVIFEVSRPIDGGKVVTSVVDFWDWHAVARSRQHISADALREIVLAGLEMIVDPDNDLGNRSAIIEGIMALSDALDMPTTDHAFDALERIAIGEIPTEDYRKSRPLDRVKVNMTSIEDLRKVGLIGVARVGKRHPERYRERVENLLEEAFTSPDVEVRRGAFTAFRDFPVRAEGPLLAVLLGTRDPDPVGAAAAFAAIAGKQDLSLNRNHWRLLLYSARLASQSRNKNLRRNAAWVLTQWLERAPGEPLRAQSQEILDRFRMDVCASVRDAATPG